MLRRVVSWALLILLPDFAAAQGVGAKYVPSKSQIFFEWDGFDSQREAFKKTGWGQTMEGETGIFLKEIYKYGREALDALAGQLDPQIVGIANDSLDSLEVLFHKGFAIGGEFEGFTPPKGTLVVVLPKGAAGKAPVMNLARRLCDIAGAQPAEIKVGTRALFGFDWQVVQFGWWREGEDVLLTLGTDGPDAYAKRIDAKQTGLSAHPLYKLVSKDAGFPVWARGYIDGEALVKLGSEIAPQAKQLMNDLGLGGLKHATIIEGLDGKYQRSIIEVEMPKPRKGLLAMAPEKPLSLSELPPLPADFNHFSASSINVGKIYDSIVDSVDAGVRIFTGQEGAVREGIKAIEPFVGLNISEDVFGCFGEMMVDYSSPSDGGFLFGGVTLFKLKDEKKLSASLDKLVNIVPQLPGMEVKRRKFQGASLFEIHTNSPGNFTLPTVGIYKGWLVYGAYPQQVRGHIMRVNGELPTWKPDAKFNELIKGLPKDYTSISYTDTSGVVETLIGLLPPLVTAGNGFTGMVNLKPFDAGLIPHPKVAGKHLFPIISVTSDNGATIRTEIRSP